jgi:hypothetical protein
VSVQVSALSIAVNFTVMANLDLKMVSLENMAPHQPIKIPPEPP